MTKDVILCHTTADFDALGAAVGLTRLVSGAKIVLTGGCHPGVRDFLALHRDEYALMERRAVNLKQVSHIWVVDTQRRHRLGKAASWLDVRNIEITLYDHHHTDGSDLGATHAYIEPVGAATTLVVEQLQAHGCSLTPAEATVMALGIHVDTGSLTFDGTTARDAKALAWLLEQGANVSAIADYVDPGLSGRLQQLLKIALEKLQRSKIYSYEIAWVLLETDDYVPGLSSLASRLLELTEVDALILANVYAASDDGENLRTTFITRSRIEGTDLNELLVPLGGGGHSQAASATMRCATPQAALEDFLAKFKEQIPPPLSARDLMSSPVRTIRPQTTVQQTQRILLRYGHSGLCVVDESDRLCGVISRRDIDLALHHGFGHAPVKGYMSTHLKTISPEAPLPEIENLMVRYDVGRLPVMKDGELLGIVTRTDVLRQMHGDRTKITTATYRQWESDASPDLCPVPTTMPTYLRDRLSPQVWELLSTAAQFAAEKGWHLYLVGGAVRDVLLLQSQTENTTEGDSQRQLPQITDIDLVVDGFHRAVTPQAGVELAKALQNMYPQARLDVHGQFQTAALLWHQDPVMDSLWLDIATARTEFYPYPAANPEVEASSIRQDLYRRDFTINALAVCLTPPTSGQLMDFFGGLEDLQQGKIRVLHPNSFIEDPTRIYRAVRFAVRLGFELEEQTIRYVRYAIDSGVYERTVMQNSRAPALETRLKMELKYILQAPYGYLALKVLGDLGALRCIHPQLAFDDRLWHQIRAIQRWWRYLTRRSPGIEQSQSGKIELWLLLLEVLLLQLNTKERVATARKLQLSDQSTQRLSQLDESQQAIQESLPRCQRPSEVVRSLSAYETQTLLLVAVQSSRGLRRQIWQYLTHFSQVKSLLNGRNLKALGYKPGPIFREILEDVFAATIDGVFADAGNREEQRKAAIAFVCQKYPLENHGC